MLLHELVRLERPDSMDIKPNHTIYINNLNEKVKKEGSLHLFDVQLRSIILELIFDNFLFVYFSKS